VLAQTLILVAFIAIVASSVVTAAGTSFLAEAATRAKLVVAPSVATALAAYENEVVAPVIAREYSAGDGASAPSPLAALNGGVAWQSARYVLAPDNGTTLAAVATITPTSVAVPACDPAGGAVNAGPDVQQNGQCSPFVQESRLSLTIVTTAGPPTGPSTVAPLAHDVTYATLRLSAQPPYVMVAGLRDDADRHDGHEGDLDGYGNAIGSFGPSDPADSTIHVVFRCTPTAGGDCSQSQPPPADLPTSLPWTNGNGNS
jgi:hypothetical protein